MSYHEQRKVTKEAAGLHIVTLNPKPCKFTKQECTIENKIFLF